MIELRSVTLTYPNGTRALDDIDLEIGKADFVFLVGHSGTGKSSLLKLLYREVIPDSGEVIVDGIRVDKLRRGKVAALRRNIDELRIGQPKYDLMSPAFGEVTRQQLPQLKGAIQELGAVESVAFKGVGQGGADIYEVKFEHGSTEWRITLEEDGKISSLSFRDQ